MFRIFLILATLFSQSIFANNYLHNLNTLVFDSKSEAAKKIEANLSVGFGSYVSSLGVGTKNSRRTEGITNTNRNFYNIGLEINDYDLQTKVQQKDPTESKSSRVDTSFESYQLSYKAMDHLKIEIYYQNIKSFYLEDFAKSIITNKFNSLEILRSGIQFNYSTNAKHKSPSIDPIVYKRSEWSSSWIFGAGINNFEISGLNEFDQIMSVTADEKILSSKSIGIDGRIIGSTVWYGQNWFTGGSLGFTYGLNQYKNKTPENEQSELKSTMNSNLSLSTGYIWRKFLIGSYISMNTYNYTIKGYEVYYNSGSIAMYGSYQF